MGDLDGTTFLVTGANTGIGRATATALARRGGRVLLACRSHERARPVLDEIGRAGGDADFLLLDLADLDTVRRAADAVLDRGEPVHVLVNNAGLAGQRGRTEQGFELAFGVNHLGHFLLTTRLLDHLRAHGPARVVNVASDAHYGAHGIDFDAVQRPTSSRTGMSEYAASKLANVCFTQELARRLDRAEITAHAAHPGTVASDIWRRVPWPLRPVMSRFMRDVTRGAETSLFCATAPELARVSGRYYADCAEKEPSEFATEALAKELWDRSEAWTS